MGKASGRKSIFITGAASGIGAETARLFSKKGWFCGLYDIDDTGLKSVAAELGEENCHLGHLNVTNREDWTAAVQSFGEATDGQMNVLFNNAGIGRHGWIEDIPQDESDLVLDVNVKGVVNGVYAALPLLKQTPEARIVNTASTAGIIGSPQLAVYSASKFAVRGLTEALDIEFSELGIRVTSLMPWFIDTPILEMGRTEGANVKMSDQLKDSGVEIYPVSVAAEAAWDAAHGTDVHYMAGKRAKQARMVARFMPGRLRKQVKGGLPPRD